MAGRSAEGAALAIMTVVEVPGLWDRALPSLYSLAQMHGQELEDARPCIRRGQLQAIGMSLALGVAASALSGEPWALLGTILMCAYLGYQYEVAIKSEPGAARLVPNG